VHGIVALGGGREVEDGFLDVRREQRQVDDLRDPRPREARERGDRGVVLDRAVADEALEVPSENEEAGDLGDAR